MQANERDVPKGFVWIELPGANIGIFAPSSWFVMQIQAPGTLGHGISPMIFDSRGTSETCLNVNVFPQAQRRVGRPTTENAQDFMEEAPGLTRMLGELGREEEGPLCSLQRRVRNVAGFAGWSAYYTPPTLAYGACCE